MSCSGQPLLFRPKFFFSDASLSGCGAFVQGSSLVSHRNWSMEESQKSTTWRELAAIKFALAALKFICLVLELEYVVTPIIKMLLGLFSSAVRLKSCKTLLWTNLSFHLSQANSASYELDTARSKLSGRFFKQDS